MLYIAFIDYYTSIKSNNHEDFTTASKALIIYCYMKKTEQKLSYDSKNDIKYLQGLEKTNET